MTQVQETQHPEQQYLDLLEKLLAAQQKDDRTNTGTNAIFGRQMRFDLSKGFPLFTTKKVHMKSIVVELIWFLSGNTNIRYLLQNNVHIWTEWRYKAYMQWANADHITRDVRQKFTQKEFEEKIVADEKFAEKWGDIGAGYGKQWRNFGEVKETVQVGNDSFSHVTRKGFDQISWLINEIKTNPSSRRLIVSGWNPHEINQVDLPPCHTLYQLFVQDGKLSCQLYQRSGDSFLGIPFNVPSYCLLTHFIAQVCNLELGDFVWTGGDVHLYSNHIEQAKLQVSRTPLPFPTLQLNPAIDNIFDFKLEDVEVINYQSHPTIKAPVAV